MIELHSEDEKFIKSVKDALSVAIPNKEYLEIVQNIIDAVYSLGKNRGHLEEMRLYIKDFE